MNAIQNLHNTNEWIERGNEEDSPRHPYTVPSARLVLGMKLSNYQIQKFGLVSDSSLLSFPVSTALTHKIRGTRLDIVWGNDNGISFAVIGSIIYITDSAAMTQRIYLSSNEYSQYIRECLQELLQPCGLWKESDFGIHLFTLSEKEIPNPDWYDEGYISLSDCTDQRFWR